MPGAGTGLVGLVCGALGASEVVLSLNTKRFERGLEAWHLDGSALQVLTDLSQGVALLQKNVDLNSLVLGAAGLVWTQKHLPIVETFCHYPVCLYITVYYRLISFEVKLRSRWQNCGGVKRLVKHIVRDLHDLRDLSMSHLPFYMLLVGTVRI